MNRIFARQSFGNIRRIVQASMAACCLLCNVSSVEADENEFAATLIHRGAHVTRNEKSWAIPSPKYRWFQRKSPKMTCKFWQTSSISLRSVFGSAWSR